jgi:hypothetical protein
LARERSDRFPKKHLAKIADRPILGALKDIFEAAGSTPILVTGPEADNFNYINWCVANGMQYYSSPKNIHEWDLVGRLHHFSMFYGLDMFHLHSGDCIFPDVRSLKKVWEFMEVNPDMLSGSTYITPHAMGGERAVTVHRSQLYDKLDIVYSMDDHRREQPTGTPEAAEILKYRTAVLPPDFDVTKTRMKVSIDWPLEAAVADRIVCHLGRWPVSDDDILRAYSEIKTLGGTHEKAEYAIDIDTASGRSVVRNGN